MRFKYRLILVIIMLGLGELFAQSHLSLLETKVLLSKKEVTIKTHLEYISVAYGIDFNYVEQIIPVDKIVKIDAEEISLLKALNEMFKGEGVTYVEMFESVILVLDEKKIELEEKSKDINLRTDTLIIYPLVSKKKGIYKITIGQFFDHVKHQKIKLPDYAKDTLVVIRKDTIIQNKLVVKRDTIEFRRKLTFSERLDNVIIGRKLGVTVGLYNTQIIQLRNPSVVEESIKNDQFGLVQPGVNVAFNLRVEVKKKSYFSTGLEIGYFYINRTHFDSLRNLAFTDQFLELNSTQVEQLIQFRMNLEYQYRLRVSMYKKMLLGVNIQPAFTGRLSSEVFYHEYRLQNFRANDRGSTANDDESPNTLVGGEEVNQIPKAFNNLNVVGKVSIGLQKVMVSYSNPVILEYYVFGAGMPLSLYTNAAPIREYLYYAGAELRFYFNTLRVIK